MVLGSPAFVMMVKTTDFADLDHLAFCGSLHSSGLRGVFAERQVSAPVMVIGSVRRQRAMQRAFAEDDDVIRTLAANGPNEPFDVGPLPRRSRGRQHLFDRKRQSNPGRQGRGYGFRAAQAAGVSSGSRWMLMSASPGSTAPR